MPLKRFYCKNCRLDTTLPEEKCDRCPRCHCGVSLHEIYPNQAKLGEPFYDGNTTLNASPTFVDGVNQQLDKRNSGFNPNPNLRRSRYDL